MVAAPPGAWRRRSEASANSIRKWVKQAALDEGLRSDGLTAAEREELNRLRRVLGVSPGGYYAHLARPPSARASADAKLSACIAEIHRRSRQTCGAPRIHAELRAQGIRVGCKRVARLLRAARL